MVDYDAIYKRFEEEGAERLNQKIKTHTSVYDSAKQKVNENYNYAIDEAEKDYEDAYRENAVQKRLNEFYIAEDMANMGHSDSGLSRSQITANQIFYSNRKSEIDRERQSMVDGLTRETISMLSELENERILGEQDIRDTHAQQITDAANKVYNSELEAETAAAKAQYEAETERIKSYNSYLLKQSEQQQSTYTTERKNIHSYLKENVDDPDIAAGIIDSYCAKYDIDPTTQFGKAELTALLNSAGITWGEYENYLTNEKNTIYTTATEYNSGNSKGRTVWNYKTDGKQKYKIEVVKDTWNLFGGVDGNAIVNISYADGTPLKTNVKLSDLSRSIGKEISELTKGSGNKGRIEYLTLDLSKEDLG